MISCLFTAVEFHPVAVVGRHVQKEERDGTQRETINKKIQKQYKNTEYTK